MEPALRDNIDDLVRDVWNYPDSSPLVDEFDSAFHDRLAIIVGPNDYPPDADGPPNDGQPVFAWSAILWVDDASRVDAIRKRVIDNQDMFAIQGHEPGSPGVMINELSGGQTIHEFWSQFIPGTGHVATVRDQGIFVLSNSHLMLDEIFKTRYEGGSRYPRLAEDERFGALLESGLPYANALMWTRPASLGGTLRQLAERAAADEVVIDWSIMRPQIDKRVLKERYPDWDYDSLTPEQESQLEMVAAPERALYERQLREAQVPALQAKYERQIVYLEQFDAGLLELALSPKEFELAGRFLLSLER